MTSRLLLAEAPAEPPPPPASLRERMTALSPLRYGCAYCSAEPGMPCTRRTGRHRGLPLETMHAMRRAAARAAFEEKGGAA